VPDALSADAAATAATAPNRIVDASHNFRIYMTSSVFTVKLVRGNLAGYLGPAPEQQTPAAQHPPVFWR
jgi:hypothetical protein